MIHVLSLKLLKDFLGVNPLSANPTKWSNTFNQFIGNLPTNCLSVFDHFVGLALKGLSDLRFDQLTSTQRMCNALFIFGVSLVNPLTTNIPYYIETSQLICIANQLTGFYIMGNIGC